MNNSKVITIKIDQELGLLLDKVKKDYCVNISALARKALIKELESSGKYNRGSINGCNN
mgnify:CR=1 FL=1